MTSIEFIRTPGFAHAQAVRVGERLDLAGQGGWTREFTFAKDLGDEIRQAFENVASILELAGASWADVHSVVSYHVGLDGTQDFVNGTMEALFEEFCPNGAPTWTCLGVAALGDPKMRVEVRASAVTARS